MKITTVNNGLSYSHKINPQKFIKSILLIAYTRNDGIKHLGEIRQYRTRGTHGNIYILALRLHDMPSKSFTYYTVKGDAIHECLYFMLRDVFNIKPYGNHIDEYDILQMFAKFAGYNVTKIIATP